MTKVLFHSFLGFLGALVMNTAEAVTFKITPESLSVGKRETVTAKRGDSFLSIAKRFDVGMQELSKANPKLRGRIRAGAKVIIPGEFQLPSGTREGIVLNLAHMRIFYFHPDGETVSTYPVGIGRQGWSTPQGNTEIVAKEKNPAWRPPVSIRREAARGGRTLPLVIPPGPRNPLGKYAMRLGISGILIHGTTQPHSIGSRSSHGCIRMFSHNIEELFKAVPIGTTVRIIFEPKKNPG